MHKIHFFYLRKDNIIKKLKYIASAFNAQSDPGVATKYIIISSWGNCHEHMS